jgi:hypothetical protein
MKPLGPKQALVLNFIRAEIAAGRPFPRHVQIAHHIGIDDDRRAIDVLDSLAARGLVARTMNIIPGTNKRGKATYRRESKWQLVPQDEAGGKDAKTSTVQEVDTTAGKRHLRRAAVTVR